MQTILCVDLQLECFTFFIFNILVYFGWAEPLFGTSVLNVRDVCRDIIETLFDDQVRRLVMVVICSAALQVRKKIERQLAIVLRIVYLLVLISMSGGLGVRCPMSERPWLTSLRDMRDKTSVGQSCPEALLEATLKVAALLHFFSDPR